MTSRHPRWLPAVIAAVRQRAEAQEVRLTYKAAFELAQLGLGLNQDDVREARREFRAAEFIGRMASRLTGEWMYMFGFAIAEIPIYTKLILRRECVVVSFHEDLSNEENHENDDED